MMKSRSELSTIDNLIEARDSIDESSRCLIDVSRSLAKMNSTLKKIERELGFLEYDSTDPYDHVTLSLRLLGEVIDETD